jgi:hypothetical protein
MKKSSSISLPTILFIVFLILKLTDNIDWSWVWVTSPLWIPFLFAVSILVLIFFLVIILLMLGINVESKMIELKNKIIKKD